MKTFRLLVALLVVALAALAAEQLPEPPDNYGPIDAAIKAGRLDSSIADAVELPGTDVKAVVVFSADTPPNFDSAGHVETTPPPQGVQVTETFNYLPAIVVQIEDEAALELLVQDSAVVSVVPDFAFERMLSQSLPLINQPAAASAGNTGTGTTVAILDTGLDYLQAAFGCTAVNTPAGTCRVSYAADMAPNDGVRDDSIRHGTNVGGIVAGVAPGAKLVSLDVFDGDFAMFSDILMGLDWVAANQDTYNIVSVNMSLGNSEYYSSECPASPLTAIFQQLRSLGVLPVVAAGNGAYWNGPFTDGLAMPACTPGAISVGAVYDSNMGTRYWGDCTDSSAQADRVTCFSQSAAYLTLLAPGSDITAAGLTMSGTSMAAPHVAGAVAVLAASSPQSSPEQRECVLAATGRAISDSRSGYTKRRLDVWEAVQAIGQPCTPPPPPATPTPSATPFCTSQAIALGQMVTGQLSAQDCRSSVRGSSYFADRYVLSGTAGQQIAIELSSGQFDTYLYLLDSGGFVVWENDDGGDGTDSRIPEDGYLNLPSTGTYTIEATSFNPSASGPYQLALLGPSTPSNTATPTFSPGTPTPTASPATPAPTPSGCQTNGISTEQVVTGALTSSDCASVLRGSDFKADHYTFSGAAGDSIVIDLSSSVFDTYLYLQDPAGTVIEMNDDSGGTTNSRIPPDAGMLFLLANGTYTIEVTSYSPGAAGSYSLSLSNEPSPSPSHTPTMTPVMPTPTAGATETPASTPTATPTPPPTYTPPPIPCTSLAVAVSQTVVGSLELADCSSPSHGQGYYADEYVLVSTASQEVVLALSSADFDTYLFLKDSNGAALASDDDSGDVTNSLIPGIGSLVLPPGQYRIEVTSFAMGAIGEYTLEVRGASAPTPTPSPSPSPAPMINGDVDCDGDVDALDALQQLLYMAGLVDAPSPSCPQIGAWVGSLFGDTDCDGGVDAIDALNVLRYAIGIVIEQNEPCTDIGAQQRDTIVR